MKSDYKTKQKTALLDLFMENGSRHITAAEIVEKLSENFNTLVGAIVKAKPAAAKGQYLKSIAVSSTMGPGVKLNTSKFGN